MTGAWQFEFACFHCASPTRLIAGGAPEKNRTSAICECVNPECAATFQLMVVAGPLKSPLPWRKGASCGSTSGYRSHYYRGEKPCDECREAHNAAKRRQRGK